MNASARGTIRRALEAPMRQIAVNAGQDGAVVVQNVRSKKSRPEGYDAGADRYEDLVAASHPPGAGHVLADDRAGR